MKGRHEIWCVARLALSLQLALGCQVAGPVIYLIPEGYVGPVIVIFGDPEGEPTDRDSQGTVVYRIPSDGVLRLNSPPPQGRFYEVKFFYEHRNGVRTELPYGGRDDVLQVFNAVQGATGTRGVGDTSVPEMWSAFIVGVPAEREDWVRIRDRAKRDAFRNQD